MRAVARWYRCRENVRVTHRSSGDASVTDMANHPTLAKKAIIYRMAMPEHICPWGLKAVDLLKRSGFEVEDHHLKTRAETDAFMAEQGVRTTPQVFIGAERVGGYEYAGSWERPSATRTRRAIGR